MEGDRKGGQTSGWSEVQGNGKCGHRERGRVAGQTHRRDIFMSDEDDYSEELWKDRQKRRGHYWKIEDEEEEEE